MDSKNIAEIMRYGVVLDYIMLAIDLSLTKQDAETLEKLKEFIYVFESNLTLEEKNELNLKLKKSIDSKFEDIDFTQIDKETLIKIVDELMRGGFEL